MANDRIQVFPPGLLGFLQIKGHGQNPNELPATLQGVLEFRDWIMQARAVDWTTARGGGTFPSVTLASGADGLQRLAAGAIPLTVPNNEWWFVHQFTCVSSLAAGDTIAYGLAMAIGPPAGPTSLYGVSGLQGAATGPDNTYTAVTAASFFAPPGAELVVIVRQITAAVTIGIAGHVRFTPLPA